MIRDTKGRFAIAPVKLGDFVLNLYKSRCSGLTYMKAYKVVGVKGDHAIKDAKMKEKLKQMKLDSAYSFTIIDDNGILRFGTLDDPKKKDFEQAASRYFWKWERIKFSGAK